MQKILFSFILISLSVACGPDNVCEGSDYKLDNGLCVYSSHMLTREILNETILVQDIVVTGDRVTFDNTASLRMLDHMPGLNGETRIENNETFEIHLEKQNKCYKELSVFVHEYMHTLLSYMGKTEESNSHSDKYFNNLSQWFNPNLDACQVDNAENNIMWEVYQLCGDQTQYEPGTTVTLDNGTTVKY